MYSHLSSDKMVENARWSETKRRIEGRYICAKREYRNGEEIKNRLMNQKERGKEKGRKQEKRKKVG